MIRHGRVQRGGGASLTQGSDGGPAEFMNNEQEQDIGAPTAPTPRVLQELFSVDIRSLAVLRIGISLMVLIDLARRTWWIDLFYSDRGIVTASQASELLGPGYWSLYWFNGSAFFAQSLFLLTALSAIGLLAGYRTRWMNILCLVLVWSLQMRNPMLLTAGHILLRMMLFWMLFLPVASVWSLDAFFKKKPQRYPQKILSVASAAILLQVAYVYFFSGLAKWNTYWLNGVAMEYAMNLEMYVKPRGEWLLQYPEWLQFITLLTLAVEIVGPVLMFVPRCSAFFRGCLMGVFWMLHLGIWLTMSIGIFSAVAMFAWIVFVPSEVWRSLLGRPAIEHESTTGPAHGTQHWAANTIAAVFLVYITLQNVLFTFSPAEHTVDDSYSGIERVAARVEWFGRVTMTVQQFRMFDTPPLFDPWYEYGARLRDGQQADLFTEQIAPLGRRPHSVYDWMQNQYWRRIHWNMTTHPSNPPEELATYEAIRQQMLFKAVERWNAKHSENPVETAWLRCYLTPIQLQSDEPQSLPPAIVWATYKSPKESASGRSD